MTPTTFDTEFGRLQQRYPTLFERLRTGGWTSEHRAPIADVDAEPYWPRPFPMHDLARELLLRLGGISVYEPDWVGITFGCVDCGTASELKAARPYDIERLVLREPPSDRPPAFPIGTMNEWMLFLREDWSTITVGYTWKHFLLTNDPFEVIEEMRTHTRRIRDDPARHIVITDWEQVPENLIPTWMTT